MPMAPCPVRRITSAGKCHLAFLTVYGHAYTSQVLREMEPVKLVDLVGREYIFVGVHDAMMYCVARLAEQGFTVTPVPINQVSGCVISCVCWAALLLCVLVHHVLVPGICDMCSRAAWHRATGYRRTRQ